MDDLISRQAAIDVIEKWLECSDYNEAERHIMRATESILYDLPSVNQQEPCDDTVSRQAVLDIDFNRIIHTTAKPAEMIKQKVEQLPPIRPQEKTGHWIAQDIYNCHTNFKCSECGYIHSFMHLYGKPTADYTYCPNCGAKMVER